MEADGQTWGTFMLGGLVGVTMIIVRQESYRNLGWISRTICFAWGISMIYIGLMLSAVSADYYHVDRDYADRNRD